jgi:hypothetical protein
LVYDAASGKFVPQDLATYVENTPSFENKIREVAGTAELVVEDGSTVVAKVNVYADSTYLPLTGNNAGDQAFATDNNILYIWDGSAWQQAGAVNTDEITEGNNNLFYTDARVSAYLAANDFDTATNIVSSIVDSAPTTLDTLNELAAALGDDANFSTTITNQIGTKLATADFTTTANTWLSTKDTDDLTEGSNLYFTDARVQGTSITAGSLRGSVNDARVQYGTSYSGTPTQGSFFFDSLNQKLKVYTGSAFVDAVPAGTGSSSGGGETSANATFRKYTYSITSSTNAVSGNDDNTETLSYVTDGTQNVEVYVNGVKQVEGATNDYVATTGTSITFVDNLAIGDVVDVQVYELLTNDAYYLKTETYTQTETNSQIATALSGLVDSAPSTLDTLNELAAALGDDANFSTTVTNSIATKAPLADPSFTGNAQFAGNLGIGITPNTYSSPGIALEIGDGHGLLGYGDNFHLNSNAYYNNGWFRNYTGTASNLVTANGDWRFRSASSGAAGSGINWSDQLYLQLGGNVGIGTNSPDQRLVVGNSSTYNTIKIQGANANLAATLKFLHHGGGSRTGVTPEWNISRGSNETSFNNGVTAGNALVGGLAFWHNTVGGGNVDVMRLKDDGDAIFGYNVGIGTSVPYGKLTINSPRRSDGETNSLGELVVAGPITGSISHDFTNSTAILRVQGTDATNNLQVGVGNHTLNYNPWLQGSFDNTSSNGPKDIILQPIGGNVGIGTTDANNWSGHGTTKLFVNSNESRTTGFENHTTFAMPNLTGGGLSIGIGKAASLNNMAKIVHNHAGDSSGNNYLGLGYWDNDNKFKVYADGRVTTGEGSVNFGVAEVNGAPVFQTKVWTGSMENGSVDLFTIDSQERPFAGTIYATAYKSSEGVSGVWTAATIYPTVTAVINNQSYVSRGDEGISVSWVTNSYELTLRMTLSGFAGATFYAVTVQGIVNQTYSGGSGYQGWL